MLPRISTGQQMVVRSPHSSEEAVQNEGVVERARQQFFLDRLTSSTMKNPREIQRRSFEAYSAMGSSAAFRSHASSDWISISPSSGAHVCGRLRSIVFDPAHSSTCYVAAAQGGIWKTTDVNADQVHWTYLSDKFPTLTFGALAIDPTNGNVLYAGTGETHAGYVKTSGFGIFKSTDAGLNWQNIADENIIGPSVASIAINPQNTNTVVVATGSATGLLISRDAGATWSIALDQTAVGGPFQPISVCIDPTLPDRMIVSTEEGEVFRSEDGGGNWFRSINGLPTTFDSAGTTSIAMAASSPSTVYASVGNIQTQALLGIWRTDDFGASWRQVNDAKNFGLADTNALGQQAFYANTIAVNPTNSEEIVEGGLNTYFSFDGGASFRNGSIWEADQTDPHYSHADVHLAVYQGNDVYLCTDGGLSKTTNKGVAWKTTVSNGIDAFQYVGIDAPPSFVYIAGGTQDNGVQRTTSLAGNWQQTRGGDGGQTRIPSLVPNRVFSTFFGATLTRSDDGGVNWIQSANGNIDLVQNSVLKNEGTLFYAPIDVSPDGQTIAMGGKQHVFASFDGGSDGVPQTSLSDIGTCYSLYIEPDAPTRFWAGTEFNMSQNINLSTDAGLTWRFLPLFTTGAVVGIAKSPITGAMFVIQGGLATDQRLSLARSTDGGANWSNPAVNGLPQIPFNSLTISKDGTVYIGTDYNVIYSTDQGANWQKLGTLLPPVQVLSLNIHGANGEYLLAGTHGRGAWYFPLKQTAPPLGGGGTTFQLFPPYPNPIYLNGTPINTTIQFNFEKARDYTLSLFDAAGRKMRTIAAGFLLAGDHYVTLDQSGLAAGEYFIALASYGVILSQRLVILTPN